MLLQLLRRRRRPADPALQLGREYSVDDVIEQRYEVQQVRRGYMGVVYIAYDRQRRQRVVLKTFQNKYLWDEAAIRRFNAEAELWIRLGGHSNIVHAYELATFMGRPHVIAEYVHGGTLRALVGRVTVVEALDYGVQIASGMQYAIDTLDVLHRDLKPDNIMVTFAGRAKVTDFGLSKVLNPWHTFSIADQQREGRKARARLRALFSSDALGGTLPYMAPELFQSGTAGAWTDIYAFGVTLYELLTGRLPYDAHRDESLIRMHLASPLPDPRRLVPDLPPSVIAIVRRCMAKKPSDRFQTFAEVEQELQLARVELTGEPYVDAQPEDDRAEAARWNDRGLTHLAMGEYKEALRCFHRAVDHDHARPDCWISIARCSLQLWMYREALQAVEEGLRRAVSRNEFGQLYGVRGETFAAMRKPAEALVAFDSGLSYTPSAPPLWRGKGTLLVGTGEFAEAQECFEKAIRLDPKDPIARERLGDVLARRGRYKPAAESYHEALQLDPRSVPLWVSYGSCLLKLARYRDARAAFEMALKLDPESSDAHRGLRAATRSG